MFWATWLINELFFLAETFIIFLIVRQKDTEIFEPKLIFA